MSEHEPLSTRGIANDLGPLREHRPAGECGPRLLFVPVSGRFGMGEYARASAIALEVQARRPDASVHFLLSRDAPYAASSPFATTLLEASPTFHTAAVVEFMKGWRPDVVIFDNAGRTAQLSAAKRGGARVIFVSARRRQRNRAFRLRWMRLIDEHWIAYPRFIAGRLRRWERLKLAVLKRPTVRFLDVILARAGSAHDSVRTRIGIALNGYVLVVPGGGTGHPGARDATGQFLDAARGLAAAGVETVFVGVAPSAGGGSRLRLLGSLPQAELAAWMADARLVLTNGGSTLLQAIACGRACIAVPIAGDQPERIRRCVSAGVAVHSPLNADAMLRAAAGLLKDDAGRSALAARAQALDLADGVDVAVRAMLAILAPR